MTHAYLCPSPRVRAYSLALLVALVLPLVAHSAEASTTLSVLGKGRVSEQAHLREIQLSAHTIEVTETITFANAARSSAEAVYNFSLPAQAVIYQLQIENPGGASSHYGVVDTQAATRLVADPDGNATPDLGLLRMIGVQDDGSERTRRYELRVFPIPGQLSTKVIVKWRSPVSVLAGRYSVRVPGRGNGKNLARSEIVLRTNMATADLYGGGAELAVRSSKNKSHRFFEPSEGDLVIQAMPKKAKTNAHAEVALFPLSPTSGVAAVRVTLPGSASKVVSRFSRVLLVVDVSRSLGDAGRQAAAEFADTLLAEMGTAAEVEAILYDRKVSRVLGSLQPGTKENRSKILAAIRGAADNNGSDLAQGLDLARAVLSESDMARKNDTLIAVISDGVLPAGLKGSDAAFRLGPDIMEDARILSAILVPPNAPLPDLGDHPMSTLAYRGHGRVAAVRYDDASKMGYRLLRGLTQPLPLRTLSLELDKGKWVGADLKGTLAPGSSLLAMGYYEGGVPKRLSVVGQQGGKRITITPRKLASKDAKAWAQMALADTSPDSFPGAESAKENRRDFVKATSALGIISEVSAAVVIDKSDAFAMDRLALATRQGGQHYRRLPPPAEIGKQNREFQRFEIMARRNRPAFGHEETGKLDRKIITRRMRTHAIPMARGCYDKLLRRDQDAGGEVHIRFELSRGEVHHVQLPALAVSLEPIRGCIADAVYAMPIPRVRQGSDPEQVNVVNYPLRFRLQKPGKGKVTETSPADPATIFNSSDPLSGLPE